MHWSSARIKSAREQQLPQADEPPTGRNMLRWSYGDTLWSYGPSATETIISNTYWHNHFPGYHSPGYFNISNAHSESWAVFGKTGLRYGWYGNDAMGRVPSYHAVWLYCNSKTEYDCVWFWCNGFLAVCCRESIAVQLIYTPYSVLLFTVRWSILETYR